jgi:hypothetical protein
MTSWGENTFETFADESVQFGESPFAEAHDAAGETQWESPFAPASMEQANWLESGQPPIGETYGSGESASEWESPFGGEQFAGEAEIDRQPADFPNDCGDVTFDGKPWKFGKTNPHTRGRASGLMVVPHAEVLEFHLSDFDVDRHELKEAHKKAIQDFVDGVMTGVRSRRYIGEPIRVYAYGEASSTAPAAHNNPLSRNRAFNVLNAIRCRFKALGMSHPVAYGLYGTGEQHAGVLGPDEKENQEFRGVIVRAFASIAPCKKCHCPTPVPPPPPRGGTAICVSVTRVAPRIATKRPPDIIPLGPHVPGLRLPIAIVTHAQASVRVDDRRSHRSGSYIFDGWGLEVALPAGRARIDLRAELHASLEALLRASASLGARLQLGPLKLSLKVNVSVFAQLIVKLCAQLRARLEIDLGHPNLPDLHQCRWIEARGVRQADFPFAALTGPAALIIPGPGYGPAVLTLEGPAVASLGLDSNVLPVPADKSSVRTLLALGGNLQFAQRGGQREAEMENFDESWPEAFEQFEPEMTAAGG